MPRQKIPIAQPLTPAQARKWLKVGMVVAWKTDFPDILNESLKGWTVELIENKDDLKMFMQSVEKDGDRVVIIEK